MRHLECSCGEVLVKSINGVTKIRNKVLVLKGNQTYAVCKGCGAEHPVPLKLVEDGSFSDSQPESRRPRLYLRER